ncbi:MAG: hypothetical protein U9Q74_05375 [Gemmatimonadota bacterium]|nr:hypothetical protein [Gemmatimonadota bacterium]
MARLIVQAFTISPSARTVSAALGGTTQRAAIEDVYGAPIDWSSVALAPWPLHARTPVVSVADSIPDSMRRALGSRTHILLYAGSAAIADLALSNSFADVLLTADSTAFAQPPPSELIRISGIPGTLGDTVPLLPEVAVRDVAARTGAKVDRPPQLFLPWNDLGPVFSRWAIHTDRDVSLVRYDTGEPMLTRDILVGVGTTTSPFGLVEWYVPAAQQPTTSTRSFVRPSDQRIDSVVVQLARDVPTNVIRVRRP